MIQNIGSSPRFHFEAASGPLPRSRVFRSSHFLIPGRRTTRVFPSSCSWWDSQWWDPSWSHIDEGHVRWNKEHKRAERGRREEDNVLSPVVIKVGCKLSIAALDEVLRSTAPRSVTSSSCRVFRRSRSVYTKKSVTVSKKKKQHARHPIACTRYDQA